EYGRLDVVAAIEMRRPAAAGREACPFGTALGDVRFHAIALALHRERSHLGRRVEWIAHFHLAEPCSERVAERVVSAPADDESRERRAHLPGEEARALRDRCGRFVDVVVVEDDRRRFAAELQRTARDTVAADGADPPAGRGRSREADLVDAGMAHEPFRDLAV